MTLLNGIRTAEEEEEEEGGEEEQRRRMQLALNGNETCAAAKCGLCTYIHMYVWMCVLVCET